MSDRLLTPREVAAMLSVSTRWVEDATRRGEIPHVRLGRFPRYRRESIERWLGESERASVGPGLRGVHARGTR